MYCDCFYDVIFNHAEGPTPAGQRWHEQNLQDSRGQRQLLDVVDTDQLSDAEATQMLQRFNAAEPGDRVQELDRGRGQTWTGHEPEKTLFIQQTERETDRWRQKGGGRQWEVSVLVTRDSGSQEVEELSVLGVHDGSLYELDHRVTTILKLRMTPETERPCRGQTEILVVDCVRQYRTWTTESETVLFFD